MKKQFSTVMKQHPLYNIVQFTVIVLGATLRSVDWHTRTIVEGKYKTWNFGIYIICFEII